jgi:hypothetical protein
MVRIASRKESVSQDLGACDRCGAPASLLVRLASGGQLAFCPQHARQFRDALTAQGAVTVGTARHPREPAPASVEGGTPHPRPTNR